MKILAGRLIDSAALLSEVFHLVENGIQTVAQGLGERIADGHLLCGADLYLAAERLAHFFEFARHAAIHAFHHNASPLVLFHSVLPPNHPLIRMIHDLIPILHQIKRKVNTLPLFFSGKREFSFFKMRQSGLSMIKIPQISCHTTGNIV